MVMMNVITKQLLRSSYRNGRALVTQLSRKYSHSVCDRYEQPRRFVMPPRTCVSWYSTTPAVKEAKGRTATVIPDMYNFLKNSPNYRETIMSTNIPCGYVSMEAAEELLARDWSSAKPAELLEALKQLSYNVLTDERVIPNTNYANILTAVENNIKNYNLRDTVELLRYLLILEPRASSYHYIKKGLDKNYYSLTSKRPSVTELLLLADALYQHGMNYSRFMMEILLKLGGRTSRLSAKNIVQFCFLLSVCPKSNVQMFDLEYQVEQELDEIGQTELGIVCLGFFRSQTRFRNPQFVKRVLARLINNVNDLDDYTLCAVLKIIRYSIPLEAKLHVQTFIDLLIPRIQTVPIVAVTHISHLVTNFGILSETVYKTIAKRLMKDIGIARLKDVERITYGLSQMHQCHNNSTVYKIVAQELLESYTDRRKMELKYYPASLSRILTCLAHQNIYVPDMIEYIMDTKVVNKICKKAPRITPYDYWYITNSVKLEYPEYAGPHLEQKMHEYIMQKVDEDSSAKHSNRLNTRMGGFICEIAEYCRNELSPSAVYVDKLLPQYATMTIVIGLDKHNNFLNAERILSAMPKDSFKYVNTDELKDTKWIAIVPIYDGSIEPGVNFLTSTFIANIRHLQLLGYHTVWMNDLTLRTFKNKENSLRDLIDKWEAPNLQQIMSTRQIITKETLGI